MTSPMSSHQDKARETVARFLIRFGINDAHINSIGLSEDEVRRALSEAEKAGERKGMEKAAKVAESRHNHWRLPHPDDARPNEVCDDISACQDIATAIRPTTGDGR